MQKRFEPLINDKYFFTNFNKLLNYNIILTFSLYKNNYSFERSLKIGNLTKLLIQFLQYLGAGFNTTFHDNIFKLQDDVPNKDKKIIDKEEFKNDENELIEDSKSKKTGDTKKKKKNKKEKAFDSFKNISNAIPDFKVNKTIYESIICNLKRSFFFLGMDNLVDGEVAYDKLIILTKNCVQFLIEYVDSFDDNIEIIDNNMKNLFLGSKIEGEKNNEKDNDHDFRNNDNYENNDNDENIDINTIRREKEKDVFQKITEEFYNDLDEENF